MTYDKDDVEIEVEHSLRSRLVDRFDEELVDTVSEVLPYLSKGEVGPMYRVAVAEKFLAFRETPSKRAEGQRFRKAAEARLDRAFTAVAEQENRSEANIRMRCTEIYDGENKTKQLRTDLQEIEERYYDRKHG